MKMMISGKGISKNQPSFLIGIEKEEQKKLEFSNKMREIISLTFISYLK